MIMIVNSVFSMLCILLNRMHIVNFSSLFVFFEQRCFIWVSNSDEIIEQKGVVVTMAAIVKYLSNILMIVRFVISHLRKKKI